MKRWALVGGLCVALCALAGGFGSSSHFSLSHRFHSPHSGILARLLDTQGGHRVAALGPITFSRNSASTCPLPDGGIEDLGVDEPCLTTEGLRMRPEIDDLLMDSESLDGPAWTENNITVTADSALAPDQTETADTVTTTAPGGYLSQSVVSVGTAFTLSGWIPSGTLELYDFTSASSLAIQTCATGRCSVSVASTTSGDTIEAQVYPAGASGSGATWGWGMHLEPTAVAHDYCPSGATSATCAAETPFAPIPLGLGRDEGCAKICVTPDWTGASDVAITYVSLGTLTARPFLTNATALSSIGAYDGTHVVLGPDAGFRTGVRTCYTSDWSRSQNILRVTNDTTGATDSSAFSGFPAFGADVYIGSNSAGGEQGPVFISDIEFGRRPGDCR